MDDDTHKPINPAIRILLIEDNEHERLALENALRNSETAFETTVCGRAEEALAMLPANEDSFDLIVVDCDLPGMTGIDFYRQLQHMKKLPPAGLF